MNKKIRSILIVVLSVITIVLASIGLAACDNVTLKGLRIDNPRTEFKIGDEFELGENFAVYALYTDGSEKDVTEEVTCKPEAALDMNKAGNYQITVSWGGKKEIYTIYVNEFDNILRKIELNSETVKKVYELGESVDLTGLEVICTYENAQGNPVITKTTSLKTFVITIESDNGDTVTDVFDKLGDFTVTVSVGAIKDSFTVKVSGVNISTIQGAIAAGNAFKGNVLSGTHITKNRNPRDANPKDNVSFNYSYEFGINYTYIVETAETNSEFHYSMEDSQVFCVQKTLDGEFVPNPNINSAMMDGTPFDLWYHRARSYGVESVLGDLYKAAKECTNKDLVEKVDEAKREYSFSFSGLVFNSNSSDYYETTVSFTLGDDYIIKHAEYVQKYWEYSVLDSQFTTTPAGYTTPHNKDWYNESEIVTVDQVSGERVKENPYSRDKMEIKSYDLVYNGTSLGDNGTINYTMGQTANNLFTVDISNIMPTTASFAQDPMYFNYPGNFDSEVDSSTFLYTEGYFAFRAENQITIQALNGGVWTLILRTSKTYKTITLNVTGIAPTSMTAQLFNTTTNKFYEGNQKAVGTGGAVYFKGLVNKYANEAQVARITSSNSANATVEETTINGVKCFKFSATKAGTYSVTVSSAVASTVTCTFTFTVSELPDYDSILTGTYTVTDYEGNIYKLVFTLSGTGDTTNGTVVITRTPTTEDDEPIPDQAKTQTLTYSINPDDLSIALSPVSGTNLGILLSVNEHNQLVLEDQYGVKYVLTRAN